MLKFKKILLSLCLCLSIFTVSCFADSQADIISDFNEFMSDHEVDTFSLSEMDMSISSQISELLGTYSLSINNIDNYLYFVAYNSDTSTYDLYFYDLGSSVIDSFSQQTDPEVGDIIDLALYTDDDVTLYTSYVYADDTSINTPRSGSLGYISIPYGDYSYSGTTFNSIFTISSNNIFDEPTGGGGDSDIFAGILATMTYILASISTVMNSLIQVDLILFVILASLTISIIYFVVKLLKGFTGNKLVNGKNKRK